MKKEHDETGCAILEEIGGVGRRQKKALIALLQGPGLHSASLFAGCLVLPPLALVDPWAGTIECWIFFKPLMCLFSSHLSLSHLLFS